jgi:hypothetical protein
VGQKAPHIITLSGSGRGAGRGVAFPPLGLLSAVLGLPKGSGQLVTSNLPVAESQTCVRTGTEGRQMKQC